MGYAQDLFLTKCRACMYIQAPRLILDYLVSFRSVRLGLDCTVSLSLPRLNGHCLEYLESEN